MLSEIQGNITQLMTAVSQLQKDVDELKRDDLPEDTDGKASQHFSL